ncbi:MAG: GAF domain-containing protein [Geobacteraceae bacterium]|nr:GAF domain-containing protein [Geobacteraceae bacterium]NTW78696.1 GAF domain-containing protein [Geobacteraceae bacterium]
MTIKTKLIANVLFTAAIIIVISLASFLSMRFLQEKLSYLTEKSTPFQMRSIELQRELNGAITALVKVNAARTMPEYNALQAEAEKSLEIVKNTQKSLEKMSSGTPDASAELGKMALELFAAVKERINSNDAATAASAKILQSMKESSARLNDLDASIRNLQANNSHAFAAALENTAISSGKLRGIEDLRSLIRDLQLIALNVQNIQNDTNVLIAKGKLKTITLRIAKNEYYRANKSIAAIVDRFTDLLGEYVRLKSVSLVQNDNDSKSRVASAGKDVPDKLGSLFQTLDQEATLARYDLSSANSKQQSSFSQSSSTNNILMANSELVALGLKVTNANNRMFTVGSRAELDKLDAEVRDLFSRIHERVQMLKSSLSKLNNRNELETLRAAHVSLEKVHTGIYSENGITAALEKKLLAIELADEASDKLREIVFRQIAKGKESVSAARDEQEKSIITVKKVILQSTSQIIFISAVAIVIGMFFGFWIYRSVLLPLRVILNAVNKQQQLGEEKATLAEAVAGGDLNLEVTVSEAIKLDLEQIGDDEMGMVLSAVVGMSEAQATLDRSLAGMTESLRNSRDETARRDHLKNGLYELNRILRIEHKTAELADEALAFIADFIGAGVGIMYLYDEEGEMLQTLSTYAISKTGRLNWGFPLGEGLPGQVALERKMICLKDVPPDYLPITSALGQANPMNVAIMPIMHNDTLAGVLEIGSFKQFSDDNFEFLQQSMEGVAIAININHSRQLVNELLEKTQTQAEELYAQQDELHQTNEELVERARMLAERRK